MKPEINHAISLIKEAHEIVDYQLSDLAKQQVLPKLESVLKVLQNSSKRLVLLNYEGPVLTLVQEGSHFSVIDQWNTEVSHLARHEVLSFISGESKIRDSKGTHYTYPEHSINAKPTPMVIDLFLYGIV